MNHPQVIPRAAATLVPVRDAAEGIEVLMLQRSHEAGFAPGAFVFPGGAVDEADASEELVVRSAVAGIEHLAHRVCAIRECFEEAGLLLARDASGKFVATDAPALAGDFAGLRRRLNARELDFAAFCALRALSPAAELLVHVGHWITPIGLPRRYDTRFFVAAAPPSQEASPDGRETISHIWIAPADALARHQRGDFHVMFATMKTLELLRDFGTVAALMEHAHSQVPSEPVVPRIASGRAGRRVLGHDDFAYAEVGKLDPQGRGDASYEILPGVVTGISERVRRITAPNPGFMTGPGTNTYLLGEGDIAVIDPGPADEQHVRVLVEEARGNIRWILVTHTHMDHSPAAAMLKAKTGAELIGMPPPALERQDQSFKPDRVLMHGERLDVAGCALRAIHTPGHASNHLCYLLEDEKLLFTGDHVMQGSTVVINPPDGNMRVYLESLKLLRAEDIAYIAPAHGFLIDRPQRMVDWLLAHRFERENKVIAALRKAGAAAIDDLLPLAYADVPPRVYPVAGRSLLAHLIKLRDEGRAEDDGGRWRLA